MNLKHAGTSKTTKTTKKIPTGLVADWQNKITKTSDNTGTQNHQHASSPLGGLADDDTRGERPVNRYDCYKNRKNDVHFFSGLMRDC